MEKALYETLSDVNYDPPKKLFSRFWPIIRANLNFLRHTIWE